MIAGGGLVKNAIVFVVLAVILSTPVVAQNSAAERRFEVASVKPSLSPFEAGRAAARAEINGQPVAMPIMGIRTQPGGRFQAGSSLKQLIAHAYDVKDYQIDGGPPWLAADYFEVNASAGGEATAAEIRVMLRALLAERFALRLHTATREAPTHVLTVARPDGQLGPRLTRTTPECLKQIEDRKTGGAEPPLVRPDLRAGFPTRPTCGQTMMMGRSTGASAWLFSGVELTSLVSNLSDELSAPVSDQTGLKGLFDYSLEYLTERSFAGRPIGLDPNSADTPPPTLVPALQQQLGLKLEKKVAPMPVIVVDAAERPTPN
jgi:uncharacterized protein (TIGR03435 family)